MKLSRIICVLAVLLAFSASAVAQYYTLGADPASLRWKTIKGDHFDVIYPRGMDSLARTYLYNFELERPRVQEAHRIEGAHLPLILHPYALPSNATVVWAPRRVDIYTTPPFNRGYADDWVHQLAVHEGRHVAQCTHFTTGAFGVFRVFLGEQSVGLGMGFYPSGWELEGDAVHSETDFSKTGRGRDPDFLMAHKADFLSGRVRSYDTYRFGSYYNFIPNKYAFGYIIETFMRDHSEYHVMGDIYRDFTKVGIDLGVLNTVYIRYTGRTRRKNFRGAVAYFTQKWEQEYAMREPYTAFDQVVGDPRDRYSIYHSLLPVENGGLVAVKSGLRHNSQLVAIDTAGKEQLIRPFAEKGLTSPLIKKDGHTLVWSEIVAHPRWELKNYSVLRSYDLNTRRIRTLTHRTRYFNPAYSPDGNIVSVTEYLPAGGSQVVLLDADKFKEQASIPAPGGGQIHNTAWLDGRIYADAILGDGQWGLYSRPANDMTAAWEVEIEPQTRKIMHLQTVDGRLMLESDVDGITNIFTYDPACHTLTKVTNARFGAFDAHFDRESGTLYYSDYDHRGYMPVKASRGDLLWEESSFDNPYIFAEAERFAAQSDSVVSAASPAEAAALRARVDSLPARNYFKPLHYFNIHSWAPLFVNVDRIMNGSFDQIYQVALPGVTLISQNHLGTAVTMAGYSYHRGYHAAHLNFAYTGWWPVLEFNVDFNGRSRRDFSYGSAAEPVITDLNTPALEARVTTYLPVNLSRGGWQSAIIPRAEVNITNDRYKSPLVIHHGGNVQAGVRYYRMLPKTRTNRMPRLGIGAEIKGAYSRGAYDGAGQTLYGYTYGYLPGFTAEQGLRLSASAQKHFGYTDYMPIKGLATLPRGYRDYLMGDYCKLTADYAIPIPINDWHPVPILLYLMRVNIVPFVDGALNYMPTGRQKLLSYGSALTLQGHIFRIGFEVEGGVRVSRYWDLNKQRWATRAEFVTGVNL